MRIEDLVGPAARGAGPRPPPPPQPWPRRWVKQGPYPAPSMTRRAARSMSHMGTPGRITASAARLAARTASYTRRASPSAERKKTVRVMSHQ